MALAERADLIVDFTNVPVGNYVLGNVGPDEPFGGGVPERRLRRRRSSHHRPGDAVPRGARRSRPTPPPRPSSCSCRRSRRCRAATVTRPLALIEEAGEGSDDRWRTRSKARSKPCLARSARCTMPIPWSRTAQVDGPRHRKPGASAPPRSGRSTTPPPTPTPCTSTRSSSRWSTARDSFWTTMEKSLSPIQLDGEHHPARALGDRLQGHGHRLSRPGHAHQGPVQQPGPVRLALPYRRARGQRDDAALPHRAGAARPAE